MIILARNTQILYIVILLYTHILTYILHIGRVVRGFLPTAHTAKVLLQRFTTEIIKF